MGHLIEISNVEDRGSFIFEKNMAVIREHNPELAKLLDALPGDGTDPGFPGIRFKLDSAKNGLLTMVAACDNYEIALHSTYNPKREASDKVRGAIDDKKKNFFVVLGFGLGYIIEELLEQTSQSTKLIIIEPHTAAFRLALESRDFTSALADPRINFSFGDRVEDALATFIRKYALAECTGVGIIEHNGRGKLPSAEFYEVFLERLKGLILTAGGNFQTLMLMGWTYQKNTMMSLKRVVEKPPVRTLFGAFKGKPAVIVSAGPSLEKNIHLLKDIQDRVLIIAVDTTIRRLLAEGIEPHLLCTGDPQEANWKHLQGTETKKTFLVAEPMTYYSSLEHFDDRLFIASYGDKVMQWIANYIPDVGHTMCWGSVATMAFDLARKVGCDPIIFIGQDLSFPGGRTYARGTYFEDEEGQEMTVDAFEKTGHVTYSVTDIHGDLVKTNRQMFAYKEWFRTEFGRTDSKVVNSTEGGILKDNCEIIPFSESIEKYVNGSFDAWETIDICRASFDCYELSPLRKGLFETIKSMQNCTDYCTEGTKLVRDAVSAIENMDTLPEKWCEEVIKNLDELRFKLKAEPAMGPFIETANQAGVLNFHKGYLRINGRGFSRVVLSDAMDLYADLFVSMGRTCRGVLPFFLKGFKDISENCDDEIMRVEEICQMTN